MKNSMQTEKANLRLPGGGQWKDDMAAAMSKLVAASLTKAIHTVETVVSRRQSLVRGESELPSDSARLSEEEIAQDFLRAIESLRRRNHESF
jgi:hypothetical protein